jgi:hypothetical protein
MWNLHAHNGTAMFQNRQASSTMVTEYGYRP